MGLGLIILLYHQLHLVNPGRWSMQEQEFFQPLLELLLVVLPPALLGSMVFHGDQSGRSYRFLAERGVSPGRIWLSRQAVGLLLVLIWVLTLLTWEDVRHVLTKMVWFGDAATWSEFIDFREAVPFAFLLSLVAYSAGQFCSQVFRSGILAVVAGTCAALILFVWTWIMNITQLPAAFSVLPIPALLLWVSYRRMPDWLVERCPWAARLRTAGWLLVPVAILAVAAPVYRLRGLPTVSETLSQNIPVPPASPEALESGALYEEAMRRFRPPHVRRHWPSRWRRDDPAREAWVQDNTACLQLLQAATVANESLLPVPPWRRTPPRSDIFVDPGILGRSILSTAAADALHNGDLDRALDLYVTALRISMHLRQPTAGWEYRSSGNQIQSHILRELIHWAAHPALTGERLNHAVAEVDTALDSISPPGQSAAYDFGQLMLRLQGDPLSIQWEYLPSVQVGTSGGMAAYLMPWERERARRVIGQMAEDELRFWESLEARFEAAQVGGGSRTFFRLLGEHRSPQEAFLESSRLLLLVPDTLRARAEDYFLGPHSELTALTCVRAWHLSADLQRWRVVHGRLPDSVDELGSSFMMPVDAERGVPMVYEPHCGEDYPPFIWSNGTGCISLSPSVRLMGSPRNAQVIDYEANTSRRVRLPCAE